MVVYSLQCDFNNSKYIGKTERKLSQRISRTPKTKLIRIKQHLIANPSLSFGYDNVNIFDTAENDFHF